MVATEVSCAVAAVAGLMSRLRDFAASSWVSRSARCAANCGAFNGLEANSLVRMLIDSCNWVVTRVRHNCT